MSRRHEHYTPEAPGEPGLFDAPHDKEQREQLTRVQGAIGDSVLAFCRTRLAAGGEFHADELRAWVLAAHPIAPASPDRILRALRQQGAVDYRLVNRARSLYRVTRVS